MKQVAFQAEDHSHAHHPDNLESGRGGTPSKAKAAVWGYVRAAAVARSGWWVLRALADAEQACWQPAVCRGTARSVLSAMC